MNVHAEMEYVDSEGINIHSDICPPDCSSENMGHKEWRAFIHGHLDSWLDESNGTGKFYIKGEDTTEMDDATRCVMAHDIFAVAKCAPHEGIEDAVKRIEYVLREYGI